MSRVEKYNSKKVKKSKNKQVLDSFDKDSENQRPKKKKNRKIGYILITLLILLLVIGAAAFGLLNSKMGKIKGDKLNSHELSIVDINGYTNILLLGIDSRDMKDYKDARTDSIIIASIKEKTGEVFLTSIYRDTLLKMGKSDSYDKITHAYAYGGAKESVKSINEALDLNIKKYVVFNFKAVADAVDSVGGVDTNIKEYEIGELNRIIHSSNTVLGTNVENITKTGKTTLNGVQALSYGRMRKGVGDDFKRNDRMRYVAKQLLYKFKTMSFSKANDIVDELLPQIRTNLETPDILSLAWNSSKYKIKSSKGFPYHLKGGTYNGGYVNFATDLEADVKEFHKIVFGQKDYQPTATCIEISNKIKALGNGNSYNLKTDVYNNMAEEDRPKIQSEIEPKNQRSESQSSNVGENTSQNETQKSYNRVDNSVQKDSSSQKQTDIEQSQDVPVEDQNKNSKGNNAENQNNGSGSNVQRQQGNN